MALLWLVPLGASGRPAVCNADSLQNHFLRSDLQSDLLQYQAWENLYHIALDTMVEEVELELYSDSHPADQKTFLASGHVAAQVLPRAHVIVLMAEEEVSPPCNQDCLVVPQTELHLARGLRSALAR